mgnify:CR=1 FL=1
MHWRWGRQWPHPCTSTPSSSATFSVLQSTIRWRQLHGLHLLRCRWRRHARAGIIMLDDIHWPKPWRRCAFPALHRPSHPSAVAKRCALRSSAPCIERGCGATQWTAPIDTSHLCCVVVIPITVTAWRIGCYRRVRDSEWLRLVELREFVAVRRIVIIFGIEEIEWLLACAFA